MDRGRCKNKFKIKHKWTHLYCGWKQMVCLRKMWYMTTWIGEGGRGRGTIIHGMSPLPQLDKVHFTLRIYIRIVGVFVAVFVVEHIFFREGEKNNRFFGRSLPNMGGWGGWLPNKVQTLQNPPKLPRKSPFSTQISPFVFPNLTKTLGWVGKQIWERHPKKNGFFFGSFP